MEVLSIDEACAYLKLAKVTIYKYVRQGAIPAFKVGRMWRFHKESLDNWLKEKTEADTLARRERADV